MTPLPRFGRAVLGVTRQAEAQKIGVVEGRDESLVIYCNAGKYLSVLRAMRAWNNGDLDALVIPERRITDWSLLPHPSLDSGGISKQKESRYLVFLKQR